jgi:PEP-CTERM motif
MKRIIQYTLGALTAVGTLATTTSVLAQNATISWGVGAQAISGDTDVSTVGTLVNAYNLGDSGVTFTTVNGVTFTAFAFPGYASDSTTINVGNYTFTENDNVLNSYNDLGTTTGDFAALSPSYRALLSSGGSSTFQTTLQLTITDLTIGDLYQFQWWDNNSSLTTSPANGQQLNTIGTAGTTVTLDGNAGSTQGSLGEFAIGTFTATSGTQSIDFDGASGSDPMLNAFQLRDVPEPSSFALLGMGALMFVAIKLRSRKTTA